MDMAQEFARNQKKEYRRATAAKKLREPQVVRWGAVPPSEFHAKYGRLPPVRNDRDVGRLFGNGASNHHSPLVSRRSLEVYPGVFSFDRDFLLFLRELSDELNRQLPVSLSDDLFTDTGIHTDFNRLRCPAGYVQTPMSYTMLDNAPYRKQLGLSSGYSARQRQIAENVWRIVWSNAKPSPVNVPKLSTSGAMRYTTDAQLKIAFFQWLTEGPRLDKMLTLASKRDWVGLANEYEIAVFTYIQKRGQVDSPDKVRKVFDLEYALSNGKRGREFAADKRVVIGGESYDDFSAVRLRVIHAGPWAVNCVLQVMATSAMQALFEMYPSTFHVNTPEQIKRVVDGKYIFCSDVTEYDRSMSNEAIEVAHQVAKEFWDERLVDLSLALYQSPYYAKPLSEEGTRGVWVGNPLTMTTHVMAGNRSGHAVTSLMAKVNKVIDTLFIIDHIYPVLGREREFLSGAMPMGFINNGDDETVWALVGRDLSRFKALRADVSLGHYVVHPEQGQAFSGYLLVRRDPNKLEYDPTPRVHTTFEKLWVPERTIGGNHRPFWPIGVMARIDNITATDVGREAWAIHTSVYARCMEAKYGGFNELLALAVSSMDVRLDGLSDKDRQVLDSPDRLHYMYSDTEISATVIDKVTSKIPLSATVPIHEAYYRGNLI